MTSYAERMEKSKETAARKQRECEAEFGFKMHSFVKVISSKPPFQGKVGRIMGYNDLRDEKHPGIHVEVGLAFSAGRQTHVWFEPKELEPAKQPDNWK